MKALAMTEKRVAAEDAPPSMRLLTDLLASMVMSFVGQCDDPTPGRYVVEVRQDGSLLAIRTYAEPLDPDDGPDEPSAETLASMYEQIAPSAVAYLEETGEKPPLAEDMFDRFARAGFDMSNIRRVSLAEARGVTLQ